VGLYVGKAVVEELLAVVRGVGVRESVGGFYVV
jgi:hypothetical protein